MTTDEAKDKINRKLPDRTKASDPMYPAAIVREALFVALDFASGLTEFQGANGDGSPNPTRNVPGAGLLRIFGNLLKGFSDVSLMNFNLAGDGFSFWQVLSETQKKLLLAVRKQGVGIGTDDPKQLLHVEGFVRSWGLEAAGGVPIAQARPALGGGTASVSADAVDTAGQISFTTGASPGTGQLVRLGFSANLPKKPRAVLLTPGVDTAARDQSRFWVFLDSASSVSIFTTGVAPEPNTTYKFNYLVIL